jgi:hypothetical protein
VSPALSVRGPMLNLEWGRVDPKRYVDFDLNPDLELASQVAGLLSQAGFDAALEPKFEQIHDTL